MSVPKLGAVQAEQAIRRKLAEGLRKTYDPTVREPLPSDWLKLIDDLELSRPLSAESPDRVWERLRRRSK